MKRVVSLIVFALIAFAIPRINFAQTITYHLHKETLSNGRLELLTSGPDAASTASQSANLKNYNSVPFTQPFFQTFQSASAVPGFIAANSTASFAVWMQKTANFGTVYPYFALLYLNNDGVNVTQLCSATGTTAITTTLAKYSLSCQIPSTVGIGSTNPFVLYVGFYLTATVGNHNTFVNVDYEGTLNGNYDSTIVVPQPQPPSISTLTPTSGAIGTSVRVDGHYFGGTQGTSTLKFNGVTASPTSWTDTVIQAPVPSGASTGPVIATVNGAASNGVTFTVPASISGLSPSSGPVGTSVTISGSSFGTSQGTSTVTFNGVSTTPTFWSNTSIRAPVPAAATSGPVVVTLNGVASNGTNFTVTPAITGISPSSGTWGTSVTITGTTFGATQGTSTVTFNGVAATPSTWSPTSIGVPVPNTAFTGPVVVTVGGLPSNAFTFATIPTLSSISPTTGGPGTYVTLTGTAFGPTRGSSTVTFNGTSANPSAWSSTSITVPVPGGATTGPVVVTTNGAQSSNGVSFTFSNVGTVSGGVTRASGGTAVGGVLVEALQAGSIKATATTAADGSYSLANLVAGTYDVAAFPATGFSTVTKTGVLVAPAKTTTVNFSLGAPNISSVSPSSGQIGTSVTVTGSGFGTSQGTSTLTFNNILAPITSWSDTAISTVVPTGATNGPLVVTVSGAPSNSVTFTVGTGSALGTVVQSGSGTPISGALVELLQTNLVKNSATTLSDGTYSVSNVSPGSYDFRFSSNGFGTSITTGQAVTAGNATTVNGALQGPGTVSGKVTKSDGITAIQGATVTIMQGATSAGTATSDSSGNYSAGSLGPGNYSVQASAAGYSMQSQNGVSVSAGNTTTANFSLPAQSVISYAYDSLGRLVGVSDSQGGAATYAYDSVGNLLSIVTNPSSQVSIMGFVPTSGTAGTIVTISGTAFSATPSQNTVLFNGTAATINISYHYAIDRYRAKRCDNRSDFGHRP